MLNSRNKSVNVSRLVLIDHIKMNLELYRVQFAEAVEVYKERLKIELQEALDTVNKPDLLLAELRGVKIYFNPPENHEQEYVEILEMMEMSVDETINLDSENFRVYIKNDWSWSASFLGSITTNKTYISSKMG